MSYKIYNNFFSSKKRVVKIKSRPLNITPYYQYFVKQNLKIFKSVNKKLKKS